SDGRSALLAPHQDRCVLGRRLDRLPLHAHVGWLATGFLGRPGSTLGPDLVASSPPEPHKADDQNDEPAPSAPLLVDHRTEPRPALANAAEQDGERGALHWTHLTPPLG